VLVVHAPAVGRSFCLQLSPTVTLKVSCFDDSIEVVTYFRGRAVYFAAPLGAPS